MTTFVLVHGAWHGGWCWRDVARGLRAAGHDVFTPTLTGLGERAHLLSRSIVLETFVADLMGVLEAEELEDVVLVGHSFGGVAITGVAAQAPQRLRRLIYLDSLIPISGETLVASFAPEVAVSRRAQAAASGFLSLPPPGPAAFGVPDGEGADWLRRRLTPHPWSLYESAITFAGPPGNGVAATYVSCTAPVYEALAPSRARARAVTGWRWVEFAASHDAMVTHPAETGALLEELAG